MLSHRANMQVMMLQAARQWALCSLPSLCVQIHRHINTSSSCGCFEIYGSPQGRTQGKRLQCQWHQVTCFSFWWAHSTSGRENCMHTSACFSKILNMLLSSHLFCSYGKWMDFVVPSLTGGYLYTFTGVYCLIIFLSCHIIDHEQRWNYKVIGCVFFC